MAHALDCTTKAVLGPLISVFTVLFLFRVVLSWFPKCAAAPTRPLPIYTSRPPPIHIHVSTPRALFTRPPLPTRTP